MTTTFVPAEVAPVVSRDRYGRPLITPEAGGKPVAYTRVTTFVDCVEDKYNLQKWMQRMVATGLSMRPDLALAVAAHKDTKTKLDKICDEAREAAASSAAATTGTALHALTEQVDRGLEVVGVPEAAVADIAAYRAATVDLHPIHIEQMCVLDPWKVAGTPDRVVKYQGKRYISDLKTGSIEYGVAKIAAQLSMYSRARCYDVATGKRTPHDAELDKGIVVHLPAGQATCTLYWVDLLAGWDVVQVARRVRQTRALKFDDFAEPFTVPEPPAPTLAEQVTACPSRDALEALWAAHEAEWTDDLTAAAKAHLATLGAA